MKNIILVVIFVYSFSLKVSALDVVNRQIEITPEEIALEMGADCEKDNNSLYVIVKLKNISEDNIYLSDSFLVLSEGMGDSFGVIENPLSNKKYVPYMGSINEKINDFQFPYRLINGHEIYIRHHLSRFYKIDLNNEYEITYNVEFFSDIKKLIFIGYAKTIIKTSDCEKKNGTLINYKKFNPVGVFVDPVRLGGETPKLNDE